MCVLRFISVYGRVLNDEEIGFTGPYVRAFFLQVVSEIDEKLAGKLHSPEGFAPYAIKPLSVFRGLEKRKKVVYPIGGRLRRGTMVSFGFSLLSKELNDIWFKVVERLMNLERIKIGNLEIAVVETSIKTFELDENFSLGYLVSFRTPTFFRKMGSSYRNLLPEPRALFMSLARIYNQLNENGLDLERLYEQFDKEVGVKKYRLKTVKPIDIGKGRKAVGFIGSCLYETRNEELSRLMGELLRIGEITNVGGSRTLGFGVIKVKTIERNKAKKRNEIKLANI